MTELDSQEPLSDEEKEKQEYEHLKQRYIDIADFLNQKVEAFRFPGISPETVKILKADDEECLPGYTTPTDEIIAQMDEFGVRVYSGPHQDGNVSLIPPFSGEEGKNFDEYVKMNSILPRHFVVSDGMDDDLKELIETNRKMYELIQKRSKQ